MFGSLQGHNIFRDGFLVVKRSQFGYHNDIVLGNQTEKQQCFSESVFFSWQVGAFLCMILIFNIHRAGLCISW
jgi:hypothetical protein